MEKDLKKEIKEEEIKDVSGGLGSNLGSISDRIIFGPDYEYSEAPIEDRRVRGVVNPSITDNDK